MEYKILKYRSVGVLLNPLFQRSIIPSIVFSEVRHDCHA